MRILIDGYNLIRRIPELNEADRADLQHGRDALLGYLSSYRAGRGHGITVVFDGAEAVHLGGSKQKVRGITVRYSPRGASADSVILKAVANNEADMLVSADGELVIAAERSGVTAVSPEFFWDKVTDEMYRQLKGEEEEAERGKVKGKRGRKLSKAHRKDKSRKEKL